MSASPQDSELELLGDVPQEERLRWARSILRISESTPASAVRGELLVRLTDCDFVPTPSWREGLALLNAAPWEASDAISAAMRQEALSEDIEAFASTFFSLKPKERLLQWGALADRADDLAMPRTRLEQLRVGLPIEKVPFVIEGALKELGETVLDSFVLPPVERATRLRLALAEWRESSPHRLAARVLRQQQPDMARLTPLVDGLADYEALVTARKKAIRSRDQEVPSQEGTGGIKNLVVLLAVILVAVLFIVASARYNGVTKRRAREDSQQDLQNLWIESQRARERELRGGRDFDPSSP